MHKLIAAAASLLDEPIEYRAVFGPFDHIVAGDDLALGEYVRGMVELICRVNDWPSDQYRNILTAINLEFHRRIAESVQ